MKTTIIISLLIICSVCKGQETKTYKPITISSTEELNKFEDSCKCKLGGTYAVMKSDTVYFYDKLYNPYNQLDTVKVEMIVTNNDPLKNQVVKIIGYEVVQTGQHIYDPSYPQYLDILKQPLSKDLTIWLAKEIK